MAIRYQMYLKEDAIEQNGKEREENRLRGGQAASRYGLREAGQNKRDHRQRDDDREICGGSDTKVTESGISIASSSMKKFKGYADVRF
jgi:hypothetical protein